MADMDRAATNRFVYQRLARPGFRKRLIAAAPDGARPIIVLMREDPISALVDQVRAVGGAGNVVLPTLNGIVVLAVTTVDDEFPPGDGEAPTLRSDATVGVLFERLTLDGLIGGDTVHDFAVIRPDNRTERGQAEVVALGG